MAARDADASSPVKKLTALQELNTQALRAVWLETFKRPAPKGMSRDLLLRALAYHMQEKAEGGLSKAALKKLASLVGPTGKSITQTQLSVPRLKPGTRLVREWRGETHHVSVLDKGFDYRGDRYASLSQIARQITGTQWSGPLFFGLRKARTARESPSDER